MSNYEDSVDLLVKRFIYLEGRIRQIRQELQVYQITQKSAKPKNVEEAEKLQNFSGDIVRLIDKADFFNPDLFDRKALSDLPLKLIELERLLDLKE